MKISVQKEWEVGRLTVYSRIKVSSMIAGTQVTSNIPIAWFLVLGCNRQARVSYLLLRMRLLCLGQPVG